LQHVNTSRGGIAFDEKENAASNSGKIEFTQSEIDPAHNLLLNSTHHFQSINVPPPSASSIATGERDNQSHLTSTHLTKQNNASHSLPISPSSLSAASFTTNSKLSSFKSITNKKTSTNTEKTLEQTSSSSSSSLSTSPQAQTTTQHLSPSPLAICDGLTISYGNSNLTQTFKPSTITCSSSKSFKESMSSLNEEKPVEIASSTISLSPSPTTHSCPK